MLLPLSVEKYFAENPELKCLLSGAGGGYLYAYMHEIARLNNSNASDFLNYMRKMRDCFFSIYEKFSKSDNILAKNIHDSNTAATQPEEMLQIAFAYYCLMDRGLTGDILECGCFKGASSCCLSHVANYFRRRLIVADSFAGLPDSKDDFYIRGQFRGDFNEVVRNVDRYGHIGSVDFVRGFYDESLKEFSRPISLLWMDVDLHDSALSVLKSVMPCLDPRGVIFSHEMSSKAVENGLFAKTDARVPSAFRQFLNGEGMDYSTAYLCGCTGVVSFGNSVVSAGDLSATDVMRFVDPHYQLPSMALQYDKGEWCRYVVDQAEIVDGVLHVTGWAVDVDAKLPILNVMLEVNGVVIDRHERVFRKDIKKIWDGCYFSGFRFVVPLTNARENLCDVWAKIFINFIAVDGRRAMRRGVDEKRSIISA